MRPTGEGGIGRDLDRLRGTIEPFLALSMSSGDFVGEGAKVTDLRRVRVLVVAEVEAREGFVDGVVGRVGRGSGSAEGSRTDEVEGMRMGA